MAGRTRSALRTLGSAPWRRAPRLLLRRPGMLVTVAAACAVTAASMAAVPLFLSSVGTASVGLQAAERCPRDTGVTRSVMVTPSEVRTPPADPFAPLADQLRPSNRWVRLEGAATLSGADAEEAIGVSLLAREGALDHVQVVEQVRDDGVWISDRAAGFVDLAAGDTATIAGIELPVAGVYRDLAGPSVDDYWCSHADLLLLEGTDLDPPPPVVILEAATFADVMTALEVGRAEGAWEAALQDGLTVADTRALVAVLACNGEGSGALDWCESGQPTLPGALVATATGFEREQVVAPDDASFVERYFQSHLPFVADRSRAIQTAVRGGVWPVAGFAALAGAGLVAAAASLWFDRRRREVTLLTVRGVSPAGLGLKAAAELVVPCVVGAIAGVGLAYLGVVGLGPSSVLEREAFAEAAVAGGGALVLAATLVGIVVSGRVRAEEDRRRRRWRLGIVPWELLLGWATVVSYQRLGEWGVPVGRGADVSRLDLWGLLFPVLFIVTAVGVLSRLLGWALRPLRSISRTWPTALYLGIRRVARYRVAVLGLLAASAISAGVLGYAATLNRSLDATLQAKARSFVGSDVAVRIPDEARAPARLRDRATEVQVHWRAWVQDDAGRRGVAVIALDPATFERAAFWDSTFADRSLAEILDALATPSGDGPIPAVVVGTSLAGPADLGIVDVGTKQVAVAALPGVEAFPGMKRAKPTVFVAASALAPLELTMGSTEAWISGDRQETLAALEESGIGFSEERRLDEVADKTSFLTVSWTFGFMRTLGLAAGVLVLGGVAVYLDARRRDRLLGHAFMRRMGLTRGQHRRALALELAASVLVGCWLGLGIALGGAWLAYSRVDPVPGYRPDPVLRPALDVIVVLAAAALVVSVAGAALAQRRVDRDDPVEVLRAGT